MTGKVEDNGLVEGIPSLPLPCASIYHVADSLFFFPLSDHVFNTKCLTALFHLMLITVLEGINLSALHKWGSYVRVRLSKLFLTPKSLSMELEILDFFCCCHCCSPRYTRIPISKPVARGGPRSPPARLSSPIPRLPPDSLVLHRPHLEALKVPCISAA